MEVDSSGASSASSVKRRCVPVVHLYQRFLIKRREYSNQYSHIYTKRLDVLRPIVLHAAAERWTVPGETLNVCQKIIGLQPAGEAAAGGASAADAGSPQVVVAGCIFKDQKLRPSILDAYSGDRSVAAPRPRANFCSDSDGAILEDGSGRVPLAAGWYTPPVYAGGASAPGGPWPRPFPLSTLVASLVTGVVVSVRGRVLPSGELAVDDVAVPGFDLQPLPGSLEGAPPPEPPILPPPVHGATPTHVLIVSGLGVGYPTPASHPLALQALVDYVASAPSVARVIVAGGLVGTPPPSAAGLGRTVTGANATAAVAGTMGSGAAREAHTSGASAFADRAVSAAEAELAAAAVRELDATLSVLASAVPIDVMPGPGDATTRALPQQPLHPVLLPGCARYGGDGGFKAVTNPYDARLGGIRIVGHSGQPLEDLARYTACSTVMTPGDEVGMWLRPAGAGTGAMEVEEAAEGAAEVEARRRRLAALRSIEEDGDGEGGGEVVDAAIAAAVSGTSKDKTMGAIVGTGAGGGAEERALAVGDGSFIASRLSRLDLLHNTLLWRHLAPTAPDTLSCYPFRDDDPFILHSDAMPHVLFAGRQAAFATRFVAHPTGGVTRLICVPDFATTGTAVLLDLASLEATPLAFAFGGLESLRAAIKG